MATTESPTGTGTIKSPEHVHAEEQRDRYKLMFEGWRTIGDALIAAAFGFGMRGMHDIPPVELLEALNGTDHGDPQALVATLRDSLLGQAWRVRGRVGSGTCDYPLCPARAAGQAFTLRTVPLEIPIAVTDNSDHARTIVLPDGKRMRLSRVSQLKVCDPDVGAAECFAWGTWIAARARTGRMKVVA